MFIKLGTQNQDSVPQENSDYVLSLFIINL